MTWKTGASACAKTCSRPGGCGAVNNLWNEDGNATTASVSFSPRDWVRLTGELIAMTSRRGEYVTEGLAYNRNDIQFQFSSRFFF